MLKKEVEFKFNIGDVVHMKSFEKERTKFRVTELVHVINSDTVMNQYHVVHVSIMRIGGMKVLEGDIVLAAE